MPFFNEGSRQDFLSALRDSHIQIEDGVWGNYMGTIHSKAILVNVDTIGQVQQVIRAIKAQNLAHPMAKLTVRAAGGYADAQTGCASCFWPSVQETQYNESFSFSEVAVGDVIIRFSEKFQKVTVLGPIRDEVSQARPLKDSNPIAQLKSSMVEVTAGIQIAMLADKLRRNNLSLSTVSMIPWPTVIGLAGTGGHGTGRDEPAFSGLIQSMTICDMNGEIREINRKDHKAFETLCSAHAGMLGIVLKVRIKAVRAFNLEEKVSIYKELPPLIEALPDFLAHNQYFTLMRIPTYSSPGIEKIDKWQVRLWNYTDHAPTSSPSPTPYAPDPMSFFRELETRAGGFAQDQLMQNASLHELIPGFMQFAAGFITRSRGTATRVAHENVITHYQASFPRAMRDVSYLIPVKDSNAGQLLGEIMAQVDKQLNESAKRHEYPITYAIYTRYLKGSNRGLSTTSTTTEDERILAIDIVTHPNAPGISRFELDFLAFFAEKGIKPRHHLGKNFPASIMHYSDFLSKEALDEYQRELTAWYGSEAGLQSSPFLTPYMREMLLERPMLYAGLESVSLEESIRPKYSSTKQVALVERFMLMIENLELPEGMDPNAKQQLLAQCQSKLQQLNDSRRQASLTTNF